MGAWNGEAVVNGTYLKEWHTFSVRSWWRRENKNQWQSASSFSLLVTQNMVRKAGDWRKNIEANSRLMKKFEESRAELEKVIQIANCCLKEKGNPEELLKKHSVSKFSDLPHGNLWVHDMQVKSLINFKIDVDFFCI